MNNPASQGRTGAEVENKSYSLFGEGHLSVTDKLKLSFGLRGTKDDRQIILKSGNVSQPLGANPIFTCAVGNTTSVVPGAGPNGETVITTAPANPCELEKDKKFDELTWSVSADYQVTDDLLVYLAHRKGYHSGAFNQRATFDLPNDYAEPEILYDVEAGLKSDFDVGQMRARANIAAYYGWFDDIQRTLSLPTVILNGVARIPAGIGNAAEARIYGIETEFTLLPVSNLELSGFYAYNHTEYREWFDNSVPPAGRDRSDYPFPYAPVHTGGLTARYTVPLSGDFGTLVLQGNFYTTSAIKVTNPTMYAEPPSQYGRIGGYSLTNFRLELNDIASAPIDLALWVNNAFDKEYLVGSAIVASVGSAVYFPGPPRIYGFDLKYRFGGNGR